MAGVSEFCCALTPAEQRDRRAFVRTQIVQQVVSVASFENGLLLGFRFSSETLERLETFIALEQSCCAFLRFELSKTSTALQLQISGPPESALVLDKFRAVIEGELL